MQVGVDSSCEELRHKSDKHRRKKCRRRWVKRDGQSRNRPRYILRQLRYVVVSVFRVLLLATAIPHVPHEDNKSDT